MSSFSSFSQTVGWLLLWCIFAETGRKMGWRMLKSWFKILVHKFYMRFGYRRIHIWLKKSANKVALSKCSTIKVCTTRWRFDKTRCGFEPRIFAAVSLSSSSFLGLRWLDWIFRGWYLPSLSINYVGMSKDIEKRLPQLYYIKMKIS